MKILTDKKAFLRFLGEYSEVSKLAKKNRWKKSRPNMAIYSKNLASMDDMAESLDVCEGYLE